MVWNSRKSFFFGLLSAWSVDKRHLCTLPSLLPISTPTPAQCWGLYPGCGTCKASISLLSYVPSPLNQAETWPFLVYSFDSCVHILLACEIRNPGDSVVSAPFSSPLFHFVIEFFCCFRMFVKFAFPSLVPLP